MSRPHERLISPRESLAQELLNHLHKATLAVAAIKTGTVSSDGPTTGVLDQSLTAMRNLIDRLLAEP